MKGKRRRSIPASRRTRIGVLLALPAAGLGAALVYLLDQDRGRRRRRRLRKRTKRYSRAVARRVRRVARPGGADTGPEGEASPTG